VRFIYTPVHTKLGEKFGYLDHFFFVLIYIFGRWGGSNIPIFFGICAIAGAYLLSTIKVENK